MCLGEGGLQSDGLVMAGNGFLITPEFLLDRAAIVMGLSVIGSQNDRAIAVCQSLVEMPKVPQGVAAIVVSLGKIGLQVDGSSVAGDGLLMAPETLERSGQIAMRSRNVWFNFDGFNEQPNASFDSPGLKCDHAKQMKCFEIGRLALQDVLDEPFGFSGSTLLKQANSVHQLLAHIDSGSLRSSLEAAAAWQNAIFLSINSGAKSGPLPAKGRGIFEIRTWKRGFLWR
jgi:hypothetical protein